MIGTLGAEAHAELRAVIDGLAPPDLEAAGLAGSMRSYVVLAGRAYGIPVAFTAAMMCPGHESWHPSPEFYYQPGGGPMFDMDGNVVGVNTAIFSPSGGSIGIVAISVQATGDPAFVAVLADVIAAADGTP